MYRCYYPRILLLLFPLFYPPGRFQLEWAPCLTSHIPMYIYIHTYIYLFPAWKIYNRLCIPIFCLYLKVYAKLLRRQKVLSLMSLWCCLYRSFYFLNVEIYRDAAHIIVLRIFCQQIFCVHIYILRTQSKQHYIVYCIVFRVYKFKFQSSVYFFLH